MLEAFNVTANWFLSFRETLNSDEKLQSFRYDWLLVFYVYINKDLYPFIVFVWVVVVEWRW
jgi:hypothetical protein